MGLSIIVSGAVISIAIMSVLFAMPNVVDSIINVSQVSIQASDLVEEISNTQTDIFSLSATATTKDVTFFLSNNGTEKLWNYEDFTVIVTYDADLGGSTSRITEMFSYNSSASFSSVGGGATTVILRPDNEISGGWAQTTGCAGGSPEQCIDEVTRDDADYIGTTPLEGDIPTDTVEFSLSDSAIPSIINDVTLRYTFAEAGSGASNPDLRVTLLEGASTIAGPWTELGQLPVNPTFSQSNRVLSAGEIASIVDYNSLSVELHGDCTGCPTQNNQRDRAQVSWVELVIDGEEPTGLGTPPLPSGWKIVEVVNDLDDPTIINQDEYAQIYIVLSNPLPSSGGDVIVSISTDNGVIASAAGSF